MWNLLKANLTKEDVAKCLEQIIEGKPYVFGDFTDTLIQNEELDKIRLRVSELEVLCPPDNKKEYVNKEGKAILQSIIKELRMSSHDK